MSQNPSNQKPQMNPIRVPQTFQNPPPQYIPLQNTSMKELLNELVKLGYIKSQKVYNSMLKELLNKINELEKENEKIKLNYKSKIEKMKKEKETIKHDCVEIITKTIKETNENWKKRLDEIKNKFKNEWNRRETLNKKNIETIIGNI